MGHLKGAATQHLLVYSRLDPLVLEGPLPTRTTFPILEILAPFLAIHQHQCIVSTNSSI
jgi:hypothetical protein